VSTVVKLRKRARRRGWRLTVGPFTYLSYPCGFAAEVRRENKPHTLLGIAIRDTKEEAVADALDEALEGGE
jgi:hypothetical protein